MCRIERIIELICLLIFGWGSLCAQTNTIFEAEKAVLSGTAAISSCTNASGGEMVKGLDNGSANSLLFDHINLDTAGTYYVELSYYSVNSKNVSYTVNGGGVQTETVDASGLWCYQGGSPANHIFGVVLNKGENAIKFYDSPIIDKIVVLSDTTSRKASAIYVSSSGGNDTNDGLTSETAIQSLVKLNSIKLLSGDSVFFKAGDTFTGQLQVHNESGSGEKPIYFGKYGQGDKPIIDGDGYLSAIHVLNSEFLHFCELKVINNGGAAKAGAPENLRYGIYFQNSFADGTIFQHFRMEKMSFENIYPTVDVTHDDNTGVNAHAIFTSGSWGDDVHSLRFDDMHVQDCYFTRTARHALVIKSTNNLIIRNNLFEHVGGAGMVIGNACTNILVEHNITDHTGSSIDSRMAGRGSGLWCFRTTNLTVQHNQFMFAKGIHDSYGMHIDIGNRNVVFQYNYSVGNEGGFVEILGKNANVGYRYNLSIADGWRKRGNRYGQIFWLAGWSGDPKNPVGSDSIFVYNNSVYVPDTISPGIWIENVSMNARIYNNIIHAEHGFGPVVINNDASYNDFDYNIWYGNIPDKDEDGESYRGANTIVANPLYNHTIVQDSSGFLLQNGSPALKSGKIIFSQDISSDYDGYSRHGGRDYFGNLVSESLPPNCGAYNGDALTTSVGWIESKEKALNIYPNPILNGQELRWELEEISFGEEYKVQILDLTGKTHLVEQGITQGENIINLHGLASGVYLLKVVSAGAFCVKQFVIY